jgi:prepilin-type N-terminal cleavage/methylation domain-containing protein
MHRVTLTKQQSGFTLVELLIVAIILAILAAIIVPQFASTTTDAQESALRANLSGLRSATDLYRQQHNGVNPGVNAASGGTCSGTGGLGGAGTQQAIEDQLTRYSNLLGQTCSLPDTGFAFGPYIQEDVLPTNPVSGSGVFAIVVTGNLEMIADGANGGWKYDSAAGKIIANDTNLDSAGIAYSTY